MQIVIPMSGFGERFRAAGYSIPKPLIEIEGKPVIAHVLDMFPGEQDFIFICNQEHLLEPSYRMESILKSYCPTGKIIGIPSHKLGPVNAVLKVEHLVNLNEPIIVNYCDFSCYWNWSHFKEFLQKSKCIGAIPAYKGFHPHSLGTTNYAYIQETNLWVQDIREKQPFTDNRMQEFASSGTYYFSSGSVMLDAFRETVEKNLNVGGEYYVSLAYKSLLDRGLPVCVYPLQHFMQWGTPEDVREYVIWSKVFYNLIDDNSSFGHSQGGVVIPMAGLGKRFSDEGYTVTKPLLSISGLPMIVQATNDLPPAKKHVFVLRSDMIGKEKISEELILHFPGAMIEIVESITEGQACTAQIGLIALVENNNIEVEPITIGACDNGALYDFAAYQRLINDPQVDIIVWGVRGYPNAVRHPEMFGWIEADNGQIRSISVKSPLENPMSDPIVIGTFTFRKAEYFHNALSQLIARNGRVNGEYYIDSLINDALEIGLRCYLFEVDSYLCWGTPNDLRTFEYWQSCFHKWTGHPYSLYLDKRIPKENISTLEERYCAKNPALPGEIG